MDKKLIKDNFYLAVNQNWIKKTKIPADKPEYGAFAEVDDKVEKILRKDTENWIKNPKKIPTDMELIPEYVEFYKMCKDYKTRNKLGYKPVLPLLKRLQSINSFKDLNENYVDLILEGYNVPIQFYITLDFKDSSKQKLALQIPGLILPDKSYYNDKKTKENLLNLYKESVLNVLKLFEIEDDLAKKLVQDRLKLDELLFKYNPTSEELADYVKLYNLLEIKDVSNKTNLLDIKRIANELVNDNVTEIICSYMPYIDGIKDLIKEDNFDLFKSYMILSTILSSTPYLSDEIRIAGGNFGRALTGTKKPQTKEKAAYRLANSYYGNHVGLYYGLTYFGREAKKDVEKMVYEMIDVYKERLKNKEWMKKETRKKAIKKLETLGVHVGFPEEFESYYKKFKVVNYENGGNLLTNVLYYDKLATKYHYSKYMKPVNKNLWGMPASMVNAYYHPFYNHIVFPAAILQKPYYSIDQSSSANYGGIGSVMAHEISHAFDNNGSHFDEKGNLSDWWTKEDFKNFDKVKEKVIKQFDGQKLLSGESCNGTLTVSENIADNGGINCALIAARRRNDFDAHNFFENWAIVWRSKKQPEYEKMLLTVDVHSPSELRANINLKNIDLFYDTYNITKKDKMYLPKEERIIVW